MRRVFYLQSAVIYPQFASRQFFKCSFRSENWNTKYIFHVPSNPSVIKKKQLEIYIIHLMCLSVFMYFHFICIIYIGIVVDWLKCRFKLKSESCSLYSYTTHTHTNAHTFKHTHAHTRMGLAWLCLYAEVKGEVWWFALR